MHLTATKLQLVALSGSAKVSHLDLFLVTIKSLSIAKIAMPFSLSWPILDQRYIFDCFRQGNERSQDDMVTHH